MPELFTRRRFFQRLTVIGGAALLAPSQVVAAPPFWVSVGPVRQFVPGSFVRVVLATEGEDVVYITQQTDSAYLALSGSCTHKGCPVEWQGDHQEFFCPCHRGHYDAAGKNIGGPPPRPLTALSTRVDPKGVLWVQMTSGG